MGGAELPMRASDADRERTVRTLRDAAVEGRLSHDSFVRRVDVALRSRDQQSLSDLIADLAAPRRRLRARPGWRLSALADRLAPQRALPTLALPSSTAPTIVVGRSHTCDVVLDEPTVSGVHAALMLFGGQWFIADRASTNGTRVNGRRVWGTAEIRPGDKVSFGLTSFRLAPPGSR